MPSRRGLYGRTTLGPLYLAAAGSWGQQMVSTQRSVPFLADSLTANYTAGLWSARVETGHRFAVGDLGLVPVRRGAGAMAHRARLLRELGP